jgi:hypothetical protein
MRTSNGLLEPESSGFTRIVIKDLSQSQKDIGETKIVAPSTSGFTKIMIKDLNQSEKDVGETKTFSPSTSAFISTDSCSESGSEEVQVFPDPPLAKKASAIVAKSKNVETEGAHINSKSVKISPAIAPVKKEEPPTTAPVKKEESPTIALVEKEDSPAPVSVENEESPGRAAKEDSKEVEAVVKEAKTEPKSPEKDSKDSPLPEKTVVTRASPTANVDSPRISLSQKPLPPRPTSESTVGSFEKSIVQEPSKNSPGMRDSPNKSPIGKAQLRRVDSDTKEETASPTSTKEELSPPRPVPPPKPLFAKAITRKPLSPYPPDSAYASNFAASMTDLHVGSPTRPATSRSMKPALRSQTKLALFPTPSASMISLRAAQSAVDLPLKSGSYMDDGIGEEADSALPMPAPRLNTHRPSGSGRMAAFKKLINFGRRRQVDVGPG